MALAPHEYELVAQFAENYPRYNGYVFIANEQDSIDLDKAVWLIANGAAAISDG